MLSVAFTVLVGIISMIVVIGMIFHKKRYSKSINDVRRHITSSNNANHYIYVMRIRVAGLSRKYISVGNIYNYPLNSTKIAHLIVNYMNYMNHRFITRTVDFEILLLADGNTGTFEEFYKAMPECNIKTFSTNKTPHFIGVISNSKNEAKVISKVADIFPRVLYLAK